MAASKGRLIYPKMHNILNEELSVNAVPLLLGNPECPVTWRFVRSRDECPEGVLIFQHFWWRSHGNSNSMRRLKTGQQRSHPFVRMTRRDSMWAHRPQSQTAL